LRDLELLLAWRSNPDVYNHFRNQNEPLEWEEHREWFGDRPADRADYIIIYEGRRVGSVFVDADRHVGVFVGETALWGRGIGSRAVTWICETHDEGALYAEIRAANDNSIEMFERCGFEPLNTEGDWLTYIYSQGE
jgi:RimJ/RimL family protein N-acetyltransferase